MKVTITLTSSGTESGPFYDLYSSFDGITFPYKFESEITRSQLVAGYDSILVPNGTTKIRIQSIANAGEGCTDYTDITVDLIPPPPTTAPPITLSPLYVGQTYQGGVITEVAPDFTSGIILRVGSLGSYTWGDGLVAARALVSGGYEDWNLPTTAQLITMWYARASLPGVNFSSTNHWALEEYSEYGLAVDMGSGTTTVGLYKWNTVSVVAVRRFFRN